MKKLLLGVFTIASLASCSQNEVMLDGTQKAIGFGPSQFGNSVTSRVADPLSNSVKLGVFAYQTTGGPTALYINDILSYQTNAWKLNSIYYWAETNSALKLFAYGPFDNGGTATGITNSTCAVGSTPAFDYAVTGTAPNQTDVIVDLAGQTADKTTVTFNLSHVLTQLKFQAKLSASPNAQLIAKIASIKVKAPSTAKFAISSGAAQWTGHAVTNTDYTVVNTETSAITASSAVVGNTLNLIPSSTAAVIEVTANAYDKTTGAKVGSKVTTIKCDGTGAPNVATWVAGTQVTYTLTLDPDNIAKGSGTAIEFGTPTVNGWTGGSGSISM